MVLCKPLRSGLIYQPPLDSISEDGSEPLQVVVCVAAMPPFSLGEGQREGKAHVNLIFIWIKAGFGWWDLDGSLCYLALWESNLGRDCVAFLDTCEHNLYLDIIISLFAWMPA